jgi:nucleoid-associated protein YgaU
MAKPYPQAGHGSHSGTEDESALAHGEASRGDAEGDGGSEADWDVPSAPDNSTLSRILGLVLVVVLAGVFSFVAYRKYDEARRNPPGPIADATGDKSPADPLTQSDATPSSGDESGKARGSSSVGAPVARPNPANPFAHNDPASPDAFQSLDHHGPNQQANGTQHNPQHDTAAPGRVALGQTQSTGNPNAAAARGPDANPFGDLGGSPERQPQQPPTQSEPPQQFAGSTTSAASPIKANPNGGAVPNASQNFVSSAGTPGVPQARTPHSASVSDDADMQNLFPNETASKHDRPAQNPQNLAARGTPFEPTGLTRTADAQNRLAPNQPAQNEPGPKKLAQTPPAQSEPLDNEPDEPRSPGSSGADNRAMVRLQQDSHGPMAATAGVPTAGRAEALLAGKERTPTGDESSFENSQPSAGVSPRVVPRTVLPHASSATNNRIGEARSPSASDDPFASGEKSRTPVAGEGSLSRSARPGSISGTVSPVGTTRDAGDYYVVQPQDNFWTISRKKYGTSRYFQALAELNKARIPDPARMRPGMKVSTPPAETLEERYGQFLPAGTKVQVTAAEETSAKSAPIGFFISPDGTPKFRTSEHDTLSEIAAKHLGRSSRWIQIYEMNRDKLSSPNQVKVGTELALPGDASNLGLSGEDDDRR